MIKKITILTLATFASFLLFDANFNTANSNGTGAPFMHTGSPHDNSGRSCGKVGCHEDNAVLTSGPFTISTNVPAGGYMPDSTYTITVSLDSGGNVFGFSATIQDDAGDHPGTVTITKAVTTKFAGGDTNGEYVTHTIAGAAGAGSKSWEFDWTAPTETAGDVTIYAAFNQANANFNRTGDQIYTGSHMVDAAVQVGIQASNNESIVYPNPVVNSATISHTITTNSMLSVYNTNGKLIMSKQMNSSNESVDMSNLAQGMYIIQITDEDQISFTERVIKL